MPVRFFVPGPLRDFSGGRAQVELDGTPATLADALAELGALYPGVARRVLEGLYDRLKHGDDLVSGDVEGAIRLAIAQEIGAGGDAAFRALRRPSQNAHGNTGKNAAWPNENCPA